MTGRVLTVAVGCKSFGQVEIRSAAGDEVKQPGPDDCTNDLGNDVGRDLACRKPAARRQPESDRRVDMAAGDMADRISHREEGETERKGYAEQADANMREAGRNNGAAAATKSQPKSANRFSVSFLKSIFKLL